MKTVYGPVPSWRLGRSLGVDPVCAREKTCSFDCVYCQLGRTIHKTDQRRIFVSTKDVARDLEQILPKVEADIITFSGTAEPTLAGNLSEIVDTVRKISDLPLAILTNSSLINRKDVRADLSGFDVVVAKLDAPNQSLFGKINRPIASVAFDEMLDGIEAFRDEFSGKLALQMMFIDKNKAHAKEMAAVAREIKPDEVQINTPLRPCPVRALPPHDLIHITSDFHGLRTVSVYEAKRPDVSMDDIREVRRRRPPRKDGSF